LRFGFNTRTYWPQLYGFTVRTVGLVVGSCVLTGWLFGGWCLLVDLLIWLCGWAVRTLKHWLLRLGSCGFVLQHIVAGPLTDVILIGSFVLWYWFWRFHVYLTVRPRFITFYGSAPRSGSHLFDLSLPRLYHAFYVLILFADAWLFIVFVGITVGPPRMLGGLPVNYFGLLGCYCWFWLVVPYWLTDNGPVNTVYLRTHFVAVVWLPLYVAVITVVCPFITFYAPVRFSWTTWLVGGQLFPIRLLICC